MKRHGRSDFCDEDWKQWPQRDRDKINIVNKEEGEVNINVPSKEIFEETTKSHTNNWNIQTPKTISKAVAIHTSSYNHALTRPPHLNQTKKKR